MNEICDDFSTLNDYAYIIVMAEYGKAFLWGQNELKDFLIGECCACYFPQVAYKTEPMPDKLWQAFCDWHIQFEYVWFDYDENNLAFRDLNRTIPVDFDWLEFHRLGIQLSKQLKNLLNDSVRVIYQIPNEDYTTKEFYRIEILNNDDIVPLILNKETGEWEYDYPNQFLLEKFN